MPRNSQTRRTKPKIAAVSGAGPVLARREAAERKPREERWEELLNAAAKIFYEKGYEASSLQDIANDIGILKGSIYYYIKTKKDLRDHLVAEVHKNGIRMIEVASQVPGNSLEKLESMIFGHINYLCNNMARTAVYLQQFQNVIADGNNEMDRHAYRNIVETVFRAGQQEGLLLDDLNPSFASQVMLSALNSIIDWYRPQAGQPPRKIAEHMARILVRGHASREGLRFLTQRENAAAKAQA